MVRLVVNDDPGNRLLDLFIEALPGFRNTSEGPLEPFLLVTLNRMSCPTDHVLVRETDDQRVDGMVAVVVAVLATITKNVIQSPPAARHGGQVAIGAPDVLFAFAEMTEIFPRDPGDIAGVIEHPLRQVAVDHGFLDRSGEDPALLAHRKRLCASADGFLLVPMTPCFERRAIALHLIGARCTAGGSTGSCPATCSSE